MTETDVLSTDTASASEAPGGNDAPTSGSGGTERRRRGGVSGMVLAELRELAGTLGVDTTGMRRGDLISEICLAVEMGCEPEDIGKTIHPHPTLSESIGMAAEVFEGVCTDLPPARRR